MKVILHVVDVGAPREKVFGALSTTGGLSRWWSTEVGGDAAGGGVIHFRFLEGFNPDMEVTEFDAPSRIGWKCVGGHVPWADNTFGFELVDNGESTRLRFRQDYAQELSDDEYGIYNYNWGYYLESLRLYCEEGAGKPYQA